MTTLAEINDTLLDLNYSLKEIAIEQASSNDALRSLVSKFTADGEAAERQRLKDRGEKVKLKTKEKNNLPGATSFTQGFSQGSGLSGVSDLLDTMTKSVLGGIGLFEGYTLGGLIGRAAGRLFFPAIGAFFGVKYLDKWIDPLVDRITGDDATWNLFGQQVDASKITSGFAGAMAVIFGKDALVQTAKGLLGVGNDTKMGLLRTTIVRKFGLPAIAMALSGTIGTALQEASGGMIPSDITSSVIDGISLATMFLPGGPIIKILAGIAYAGAKLLGDWFQKEKERIVMENLAKAMADLKVVEDPNTPTAQKIKSTLDVKTAIIKAEQAAITMADAERKAAALEAAAMLRRQRRIQLDKVAEEEAKTVEVGQRLLGPELAQIKLQESSKNDVSVDADALEKFLLNTVDLTPEQIQGMTPDEFKQYLETLIASDTGGLIKTQPDVETAVSRVMNGLYFKSLNLPKELPVATVKPTVSGNGSAARTEQIMRSDYAIQQAENDKSYNQPPVVIQNNGGSNSTTNSYILEMGQSIDLKDGGLGLGGYQRYFGISKILW